MEDFSPFLRRPNPSLSPAASGSSQSPQAQSPRVPVSRSPASVDPFGSEPPAKSPLDKISGSSHAFASPDEAEHENPRASVLLHEFEGRPEPTDVIASARNIYPRALVKETDRREARKLLSELHQPKRAVPTFDLPDMKSRTAALLESSTIVRQDRKRAMKLIKILREHQRTELVAAHDARIETEKRQISKDKELAKLYNKFWDMRHEETARFNEVQAARAAAFKERQRKQLAESTSFYKGTKRRWIQQRVETKRVIDELSATQTHDLQAAIDDMLFSTNRVMDLVFLSAEVRARMCVSHVLFW
jgi:hypothetical protein